MKRECGECNLCCIVFTVPEMSKPAQIPCKHICNKGCAIHNEPRPEMCTGFLCDWLLGLVPEEMRPDKCGLVYNSHPNPFYRGKRVIFATLSNPYAHLRRNNEQYLNQLKVQGNFISILYKHTDGVEESSVKCSRLFYNDAKIAYIFDAWENICKDGLKANRDLYNRRSTSPGTVNENEE